MKQTKDVIIKNMMKRLNGGVTSRRKSNFELLRLFSVHGIVLMHVLGPYLVESSSVTRIFVIFVNSIANCGVSIFELLSGYFGVKRSTDKIFKYWTITVFYSLMAVIVNWLVGSDLSIKSAITAFLPISYFGNWYMVCYILLLIFADYINLIPEVLSNKSFERLLLMGFILLYILPTLTQSSFTLDHGKGVINFVFMYFVGRYIRLYGEEWKNIRHIGLITIFILSTGFLINVAASYLGGGAYSVHLPFAHDNSFFIAIGSIGLFMIFRTLNLDSTVVNKISKHTIGIYMLNAVAIQIVSKYIPYVNLQDKWYYFLILFAISVLVMIVCLVFDVLRTGLLYKFEKIVVRIETYLGKFIFNKTSHILGRMADLMKN